VRYCGYGTAAPGLRLKFESTMVMAIYENTTGRDMRIVNRESRGMIMARRVGVKE
jgi:hypothetical protein